MNRSEILPAAEAKARVAAQRLHREIHSRDWHHLAAVKTKETGDRLARFGLWLSRFGDHLDRKGEIGKMLDDSLVPFGCLAYSESPLYYPTPALGSIRGEPGTTEAGRVQQDDLKKAVDAALGGMPVP